MNRVGGRTGDKELAHAVVVNVPQPSAAVAPEDVRMEFVTVASEQLPQRQVRLPFGSVELPRPADAL
jgi:hypothetical protein